MPESPEEYYGARAERLDETYPDAALSETFRADRDRFTALLPGDRVLDVGCGPGRDVQYFVDGGLDAVGVDTAAGMLERARATKDGAFRRMDMRDLAFPDDRFDGVWSAASLFCVPPADMERALREWRRVLVADGVLFVGTKCGGDGRVLKEKWGGSVPEWHLSRSRVERLLRNAGFWIVHRSRDSPDAGPTFHNFLCRPVPVRHD